MNYSNETKAAIFRACRDKTYMEVGKEFGLDKIYSKKNSINGTIGKIFNQVKNDPITYGVGNNEASEVAEIVGNRQVTKPRNDSIYEIERAKEEKEIIDSGDVQGMVRETRNLLGSALLQKARELASSPRKLSQISLKELGTTFAILIDKGLLLDGKATEHIAHYTRIDGELPPEKALEMIMEHREKIVSQKERY